MTVLPCRNNLWSAPQRPIDSDAESKRIAIANDPLLIEAAHNYKPSAETLSEMAKYKPTIPSMETLFMVLS